MVFYRCDLCDEIRNCVQKQIDGMEYDLCTACWNSLAEKLRGKGRKKRRESIMLPALPRPSGPRPETPPDAPKLPPDIIAGSMQPN